MPQYLSFLTSSLLFCTEHFKGYCKAGLSISSKGGCTPCLQIWWSLSLVGAVLFLLGMIMACCCCCCCLARAAKKEEKEQTKWDLDDDTTIVLTRKEAVRKYITRTWNNFFYSTRVAHATPLNGYDTFSSTGTHLTNEGFDRYGLRSFYFRFGFAYSCSLSLQHSMFLSD